MQKRWAKHMPFLQKRTGRKDDEKQIDGQLFHPHSQVFKSKANLLKPPPVHTQI